MEENVLVVEHHSRTRLGICELLNRTGVRVRSAKTIGAALQELSHMPALVVLDLSLPDGNGIEVLEAIRKAGLATKVAVLSSGGDAPSFDWMPVHKPDAVFGKPFDFADFADWLSASRGESRDGSMSPN
jgi:CheY-like chemotaxis protein